MSVESSRQLLEEANAIENAIAQRFQRNAALRKVAGLDESHGALDSSVRSHKETLGQAHELQYFADQYQQNSKRLKRSLEDGSLTAAFAEMADPGMKFGPLMSLIEDINSRAHSSVQPNVASLSSSYAMFLSAPEEVVLKNKKRRTKRRNYLASVTAFVAAKLSSAFTELEMYGKYVDLTLFYDMYKTLSLSKVTYTDYLRTFTDFDVSSKSHEYVKYLESLRLYLRTFAENAFPLDPFVFQDTTDNDLADGQVNEKGEVFCKACNKLFLKKTVYDGHLSGKRHKKLSSGTSSLPQKPYERIEKEIVQLQKHLAHVIDLTANDHERRSRMFEREKQIELDAIEGNESDFTNVDSDSEKSESDSDDDLNGSYERDLPIGADGIPIPLWLYKLQGLHKSYSCEICGNQMYRGRQQFDKHFGLARHIHGLKCLGISDKAMMFFTSVSGIEEAQKLWESVRKNMKDQEEETKEAIEVEDDSGNVMSHKDYMELKKQGLI